MIGIIVAMESELQPYFDKMPDFRQERVGQKDFFIGILGGKEVVFVLSGIGKVNASYASTLLLNHFNIDFIISTGVSGGLGRSNILEMVVADKVVQHDCDSTALGDPIGFVSSVNRVYFQTNQELSKKFVAILNAKLGTVACGDQFVASKVVAKSIVDNFDAIACDMESGAIGQIAFIEKVPFVVLRCISDGADEKAEVTFNDVLAFASKSLASAVVRVLEKL